MPPQISKLLICDDEPVSVALLIAFLAAQKSDIRVALDGLDAIDKAVSGQPDLILLDISMPGLDGYATCQRLKANPATATIPVIFLSGRDAVEDRLRGFAVGGVDYITKPFSAEEVRARIGVHLHAKQQVDELRKLVKFRGEWIKDSGRPRDHLFYQALTLLEENLAQPPSLIELAHRVGTNERKLTELFRHFLGMTVFDFLSERRLEIARQLLEGSLLQVRQISDRVGYRNPGDFTRAFRRLYGVTPRDFRRGLGSENAARE